MQIVIPCYFCGLGTIVAACSHVSKSSYQIVKKKWQKYCFIILFVYFLLIVSVCGEGLSNSSWFTNMHKLPFFMVFYRLTNSHFLGNIVNPKIHIHEQYIYKQYT